MLNFAVSAAFQGLSKFQRNSTLQEFACLPFGLALAPRLFTKIMKPVLALLRRSGVRMIIYLDDLLFLNASEEGLRQNMATARYLRENLGFVITLEKSVFVPTQKLEFLGFVINTIDMILVLPDDKVRSIKSLCTNLRDLSQLIGKLTSSKTSSIRVVPREMVTTHVYPYQGRPRRRFTKYVSIGIVQNKDWTCGPVDPWTH